MPTSYNSRTIPTTNYTTRDTVSTSYTTRPQIVTSSFLLIDGGYLLLNGTDKLILSFVNGTTYTTRPLI